MFEFKLFKIEENIPMILKNALHLRRNIEEYRQNMCELANKKGIDNPEVLKISQELDKKINVMQRLLFSMHSDYIRTSEEKDN